jgi:hypothetical protein
MKDAEIKGWITIAGTLINMGFDAAPKIAGIVQMFRPTVSVDEINTIVAGIKDAERRRDLARRASGNP